MNHYPHHIGDFNNGTRHLTRTERSIYRDLIELYYDTEAPLTSDLDALGRRIIARSEEEKAALVAVLGEFFQKDGDVYRHSRCEEEIAKYLAFKEDGKRGAEKRWGAKNSPPIAPLSKPYKGQDSPPTQTLIATRTNNHKPIYTPLPPVGGEDEEEVVVGRDWAAEFEAFWAEYPETRKKNRYRVESAWSATRHHLPPKNELQAALRAFKASQDWKREGGKFIPAPETWIMERRWQDAPAYSPKAAPKPKPEVNEADAFRWRSENYPDSLEIHPSISDFPFRIWPEGIRREYLESKKKQEVAAA